MLLFTIRGENIMKKKQLVSFCLAATLALSTFSASVDAASRQYKVKKGD
ncbi:hypothetical protein [Bacillus sp. FJAT-49711]|nr:hypothetical protein [Bacillus sp. FJAT-49711]